MFAAVVTRQSSSSMEAPSLGFLGLAPFSGSRFSRDNFAAKGLSGGDGPFFSPFRPPEHQIQRNQNSRGSNPPPIPAQHSPCGMQTSLELHGRNFWLCNLSAPTKGISVDATASHIPARLRQEQPSPSLFAPGGGLGWGGKFMSHPCRAACLPGRCLLQRFLLFLTVVSFVEHFVDADSYLDDKWDPIDQRSTDGARRLYRGTWATIINIGSRLGCQSTRRWAMDGRSLPSRVPGGFRRVGAAPLAMAQVGK